MPNCFPKWLCHFSLPLPIYWYLSSSCFISLPTLSFVSHPSGCKMIYGFNLTFLMTNDMEYLFMSHWPWLSFVNFFFMNLFPIFKLYCLHFCSWWKFFICSCQTCIVNIFFPVWALTITFDKLSLNFDKGQFIIFLIYYSFICHIQESLLTTRSLNYSPRYSLRSVIVFALILSWFISINCWV